MNLEAYLINPYNYIVVCEVFPSVVSPTHRSTYILIFLLIFSKIKTMALVINVTEITDIFTKFYMKLDYS